MDVTYGRRLSAKRELFRISAFSGLVQHGQYSDVRRILHDENNVYVHWGSADDPRC